MKALWLALLALTAPASADVPGLLAELSCRSESVPGRVLCELKYRARPGTRLVWTDALVTAAPDFARPLRARVTPGRFKDLGSVERRVSLGFVATKHGLGQVTVRARAVICSGEGENERCHPESQDTHAELRVGD